MAIKRIGLSWIGTTDIKKSKNFFTNILGLNVFEEQPEYGWLEVQGLQKGQTLGIGLASPESGMPAGVNAVVTFVVDNYDNMKQDLMEKGVTFFGELAGIPAVPRMICFKDPDGNTFQIVEETVGHTDKI